MGNLVPLLINLVTGAVGGNVAGALFKNLSLGTLGNSLSGIAGGGLGAWAMSLMGMAGGGDGTMDLTNILTSVASGGIGGTAVMAIVGFIKKAMAKS